MCVWVRQSRVGNPSFSGEIAPRKFAPIFFFMTQTYPFFSPPRLKLAISQNTRLLIPFLHNRRPSWPLQVSPQSNYTGPILFFFTAKKITLPLEVGPPSQHASFFLWVKVSVFFPLLLSPYPTSRGGLNHSPSVVEFALEGAPRCPPIRRTTVPPSTRALCAPQSDDWVYEGGVTSVYH